MPYGANDPAVDQWGDQDGPVKVPPAEPDPVVDVQHLVDGANFLLDLPAGVPAVWGEDDRVLWARGESLLVFGPPGVGKTTLVGELLTAALGLSGPALGLPVSRAQRVLYLAMDRPQQIARALARRVGPEHRAVLAERLVVWKGPPPQDLARHPHLLVDMATEVGADVVVIDSLKDAAVGLSEDEVGSGWNRARQRVLAAGIELVELHHTVKRGANGTAPTSLADVYGSTWITSGAGSVIMLVGDAGDPVISLRHIKQPAAEVGPMTLVHDQDAGTMTADPGTDLLALVRKAGDTGVSAKQAAVVLSGKAKPDRRAVEKARRSLDQLARKGLVERQEGVRGGDGGGTATTWCTVPLSDHGSDQGPVSGTTDHEPTDRSRQNPSPQVRTDHGTDRAAHAPTDHDPHHPFRGGVVTVPVGDQDQRALRLVRDRLGGELIPAASLALLVDQAERVRR